MVKLHQKIFDIHKSRLDLEDKLAEGRLVAFSAVPGSGKSELTTRLADRYGYVRIANKDIRECISLLGLDAKVAVADYTLWLLTRLTADKPYNIVFDRNIDQWYEPLRQWTAAHNYRLITVGMEVSRDILESRLLQREGTREAKAFGVLDFYEAEHAKMHGRIERDVVFRDDFDLDEAAEAITKL